MAYIATHPGKTRHAGLNVPRLLSALSKLLRTMHARAVERQVLSGLRDRDLKDAGLERPGLACCPRSFEIATQLHIRANGGNGLR